MRVRHNLALFLGNLEVRVQNHDRGRETAKGSDQKVVGIEGAVKPTEPLLCWLDSCVDLECLP
jgi:hypothetical protein